MKTRVVVLSASVGAGHLRAAEAVELALKQIAPDIEVQNRDVLDFTNAVFRRMYSNAYLDLVNYFPHFVGYFYDWLEGDGEVRPRTRDRLRQAVQKLNLRAFERFLQDEQWSLVINTHFLPAELISTLRTSGKLNQPQVTVCTDFDTHRLWVNQPTDRYFCATDEGSLHLQHYGVPAADIDVTGIPIHPVFAEPADRARCLAQQGLVGDRPILLQLCGGFGVGPVEAVFRSLLAVEKPAEVVVVCGRNAELKETLEKIEPSARHRVKILGLTREIDQLMACADLVVTKPGGLTTSECLARGLPMVIVNPIPGQESRNSDFLLESGAGVKVNHVCTLTAKLNELLHDTDRLARLRAAAKSLGHPAAAFEVARRSLAVIGVRSATPAHC
ncbi:MAG TPA: glycosyltransferase [Pirellulales bacterium]|jgi:processive 1,2-diacylglycerol beta-glucosyltransferase